jgi:hypothetical protein
MGTQGSIEKLQLVLCAVRGRISIAASVIQKYTPYTNVGRRVSRLGCGMLQGTTFQAGRVPFHPAHHSANVVARFQTSITLGELAADFCSLGISWFFLQQSVAHLRYSLLAYPASLD